MSCSLKVLHGVNWRSTGGVPVFLSLLLRTPLALSADTIRCAFASAEICRPTRENNMKDAHNKAAESHEAAAKSHPPLPNVTAKMIMPRVKSTQRKPNSTRKTQTITLRRRTAKAPNRANDFSQELTIDVSSWLESLRRRRIFANQCLLCVSAWGPDADRRRKYLI